MRLLQLSALQAQVRSPRHLLERILHGVPDIRRPRVEWLQRCSGSRAGERHPALYLDDDAEALMLACGNPSPLVGRPPEQPPGTAEVTARPVGITADEVCVSLPPPPLGRYPTTPVDGELAVRKGGDGAAQGALKSQAM